jgi:hypothetical protein
MQEIKGNSLDQNIILVSLYARLKNLIHDEIPKLEWEKKYDLPENVPKDKLVRFEPEKIKDLKTNFDIRDNINEWVEDTLFCVILRKRYDNKGSSDNSILFLFRLMAILYRITYPLRGPPLAVDDDLRIVLECKIVNACLL